MISSAYRQIATAIALTSATTLAVGAGFNSGSTGADGAFNPSVDITVPLPPSGILNYTTVNIPAGVTVRFGRNATNTPVILLATGDVIIAGTLDVSGGDSLTSDVNLPGDRSIPGLGGPGGFDGGRGGLAQSSRRGGNGLGPGGGRAGETSNDGSIPQGGGGGGYGVGGGSAFVSNTTLGTGIGGGSYGSALLAPLVGGSGGGGGGGAFGLNGLAGSGGGGGGGAILIASSGTVNVTGSILAHGGNSGNTAINSDVTGLNGSGGGGSGGAIRIVAAAVIGSGTLNVSGGLQGNNGDIRVKGGAGGLGRKSIEVVSTGTLKVSNTPSLIITSVAGIAAPAAPTGAGDISVPDTTPNPVTVNLMTTGVPPGGTVALTLTPLRGANTTATSTVLTGSVASATATASIDIPLGISALTASTSFTLTVAQGEALSRFAQNERVERVTLVATYGGPQQAKLITVSGKEYVVPAEVLRMASIGG